MCRIIVLKNLFQGKTETCRETNYYKGTNLQQKRYREAYMQNASRLQEEKKTKGHNYQCEAGTDTKRYTGLHTYVYADNVQADKRHE
jgi:hypothetical protein